MTAQEIIEEAEDTFLLDCIRDLDKSVITFDAPIRDLCSRIYKVPMQNTSLMQIIGLAPLLAQEIGNRYLLVCKEEGLM